MFNPTRRGNSINLPLKFASNVLPFIEYRVFHELHNLKRCGLVWLYMKSIESISSNTFWVYFSGLVYLNWIKIWINWNNWAPFWLRSVYYILYRLLWHVSFSNIFECRHNRKSLACFDLYESVMNKIGRLGYTRGDQLMTTEKNNFQAENLSIYCIAISL